MEEEVKKEVSVVEDATSVTFERDEVIQFLGSDEQVTSLDLIWLELGDWILLQRQRFDLFLVDEPFHAIHLLFNITNGHFIHR